MFSSKTLISFRLKDILDDMGMSKKSAKSFFFKWTTHAECQCWTHDGMK